LAWEVIKVLRSGIREIQDSVHMCFHFMKGDLEPFSVEMRLFDQFLVDERDRFITDIAYFIGIGVNSSFIASNEYMVKLMFSKAIVKLRLIGERKCVADLGMEAKLFKGPAPCCIHVGFPWAGMTAACVGPKSTAVVFGQSTLL
jgi:hypothetical protein